MRDAESEAAPAPLGVRFHPAATREMLAAAKYYERERTGLGEDFLDEVDRAINLAIEYPEGGTSLGNRFRWVLMRRFRYAVVYRLRNGIEIIAVAHLRRRPGYWRRRGDR